MATVGDPCQYESGFIESNAAQTSWFVPHDLRGLALLMGGKDKASEKLNSAFEVASKLDFTSGKAHANELHEAYSRIPDYYKGMSFVIEVKNNKPENYFIQSALINGKPLSGPWFYHDEITGGGKLILEMGKDKNQKWGGE